MSYFIAMVSKTEEEVAEQNAEHENDLYRLRVYTEALKLVGPFYEALHAGAKIEKFSFEGGDQAFNKDVTTVANELAVIWAAKPEDVATTVVEATPATPSESSAGMPGGPTSPEDKSVLAAYQVMCYYADGL
jgi:hypothetical protein